ncbi:hypothetical protein ACTOB_001119 [Actinoplanes oblitus]|uniref:Uncharacterized protein n=1 Tax=Actinoplanes oblitus TaxID=3040509 RepID=A0ABY8WI89_9ACTN|nr:hypothetical protein [Actinoplanes oblitus]WIM97586.1 hypothetical protein ACTOB_001119 [Actinoplanes oblitus]
MAIDAHPRSYIYLSRRLLRELHQRAEAQKGGVEFSVTAKVPGLDARGERRKLENNDYWLARQVTAAIRDNTGTLLHPGTYVRARMEVTWAEVPFLEGGHRVAWLSCFTDTEEGPVFAALCGSLRNFEGYASDDDYKARGGWYPSAPVGMAKLVSSFSRGNEDINGAIAWSEEEDIEKAVTTAMTIYTTLGRSHIAGRAELEVLFQVFGRIDYPEGSDQGRAAMLGTPIWAATCPPLPDRRVVYARQLPALPEQGSNPDEMVRMSIWRRIVDSLKP